MVALAEPQVHRWTRDEYYKMAEIGLFEHKRVELIEGRVIEMSPIGSLHATGVTLAAATMQQLCGPAYFVRWQMPLGIAEHSEPEPDVAVIAGNARMYTRMHPATAALIIEVAETSLTYDRIEKTRLYARAGIADYWIINLIDHQLEVYREPLPAVDPGDDFMYATKRVLTVDDTVSPLFAPEVQLAVADLLP